MESPDGGNPQYDLSDLEDCEVPVEEDKQPMMRGKSTSSDNSPDQEESKELSTSEKTANNKQPGGRFVRLFSSKPNATKTEDSTQEEKKTSGGIGSKLRKKDWSREQQALVKLKNTAAGTLSTVGTKAAEGGVFVWEASKRTAQATADGIRKLKIFGTQLDSLCKTEGASRPCPRLLLICCTALVSGGLNTENLFKEDAPGELVDALADHFYLGHGAVLPPQGASPNVMAGVIKQFLANLDEPLLTYRLIPEWISSGKEPMQGRMVMSQLPSANLHALDVLLDCCHRIIGNGAINDMEAKTLAEALVPCLAWKQPPKPTPTPKSNSESGALVTRIFRSGAKQPQHESEDETVHLNDPEAPKSTSSPISYTSEQGPPTPPPKPTKEPLQGDELESVINVIAFLIAEYKTL